MRIPDSPTLALRLATPDDMDAVAALLARSYPRLVAAECLPSVRVTALPILMRAPRPDLLAEGRCWLAESACGRLLGAGGWSIAPPPPGVAVGAGAAVAPAGPRLRATAHLRQLATDPEALRRGVGRAILQRCMAAARAAGAQSMECLSTRMAVPFLQAQGFRGGDAAQVTLAPGIVFPAVRMRRDL